jgi:hypothetical protein
MEQLNIAKFNAKLSRVRRRENVIKRANEKIVPELAINPG